MAVFDRRAVPPLSEEQYQRYRRYVREDFRECCAYCLLHELLAGGQDNFELDHFFPKSKPSPLAWPADFYNLYYACHICNHYKSNCWPSDGLLEKGYRFVDFCREEFSQHFAANGDGSW